MVALGGGYLTDADRAQTVRVLNLVEHARDAGVPVALVGQGLGPLDDSGLQARAAQVLPKVGLIALREGRQGPQILDRAGVAAGRVLVTGDDAIELAYHARNDEIGSDIGFCLRVAGYAPVPAGVADLIGRVVRSAAAERTAALVPLIIAEYRSQDRRSTLPLVRGYANVIGPLPRYVHPVEIARRVGRCRVVVTGAYHLAVFALSQGIPVVALTSSAYYDNKFLGLSAMFGQGLNLVRLDDPCLEQTLATAIDRAWLTALAVREPLRARARMQIDASRAAFDRVATLTQARATVPIASPHDHLASAANPVWLPTPDKGATAGTDHPREGKGVVRWYPVHGPRVVVRPGRSHGQSVGAGPDLRRVRVLRADDRPGTPAYSDGHRHIRRRHRADHTVHQFRRRRTASRPRATPG